MRAASFLITGIRNFTKEGYEKASKSFTEAPERPDLRGKLIMVTGANQGIGLQIATSLASKGCNVMMVCRNGERGNEAVESVKAKTNNQNVELGICDVSSLSSIKEFTSDFNASGKSLYCLVNNAGALYNDGEKSVDGYELNFALNTLGTYALTRALKPALEASAPSRVIFVSSGGKNQRKYFANGGFLLWQFLLLNKTNTVKAKSSYNIPLPVYLFRHAD